MTLATPLATFVYYAAPDVVRRPTLRRLVRTGALAVIATVEVARAEFGAHESTADPTAETPTSSAATDHASFAAADQADHTPIGQTNQADLADQADQAEPATSANTANTTAPEDDVPSDMLSLAKGAFAAQPGVTALIGAAIVAATAATTAASVYTERALFRGAEKRRATGDRLAHTKQAAILALAMAGLDHLSSKLVLDD